ncbi:MAG: MupG family TIM beta-alpha barrel fold protein [Erysipelotrichaceae bacterium]
MIGISIYPLQSELQANLDYIKKAHDLGYGRLFTSMLELNADRVIAFEQIEQYRTLLTTARDLGMEVFIDINHHLLTALDIDPNDMKFYVDLGATGIRLDAPMSGFHEAAMTFNQYGLVIEVNGSFDTGYIDSIVDLRCRKEKLYTCHNFYPEQDTGLSMECFLSNHARHKKLGLRTAAFVSGEGRMGPWPMNDGLCTLEDHRNLPIEVAAQELFALGIDDVIIGDAFASDLELQQLANIQSGVMRLRIQALHDTGFNEHFVGPTLQNRWDSSDRVLRNYASRLSLKKSSIASTQEGSRVVMPGTILLNNDLYANYKGELLVALQVLSVDDRRNTIAKIHPDYVRLLPYIKGGNRFVLEEI